MSYTIIRSFKATPEKLFFNCGDNNIVPHIWSDCDMEASDSNIKSLCLGLLHWSYQPYSSIKLAKFGDWIRQEYTKLKTVSCFEKDWQFDVNRSYKFDEMFAETIGVAFFKDFFYGENMVTQYVYKKAKEALTAYEEESSRLYKEAEEKQKQNNIIHIRCALYSDIFTGCDILIDDSERLIIAKRENYDNHGHLDNSDESSIVLDGVEASSRHLYFLSDGSGLKYVEDEVYDKIEKQLLNKNVELYNHFHILRLAKKSMRD